MNRRNTWALALLALPAAAPVIAQQTQANAPALPPAQYYPQQQQPPPPQPTPVYQPPAGYAPPPGPTAPPPAYYPQPPPSYQTPAAYQPPANYQAPPNYYQAPQSSPPPPNYPPAPGNPPAPSYPPAVNQPASQPSANSPPQPQRLAAAETFVPYHVHRDVRNGHDHVYPDRGALVRDLPRGALVINYAGVTYRFHDGVWLEPRGPAFMVIAPPIGLLVQTLPAFASPVASGGESLLYANEVYYQARPDIGGYEVVNDPQEELAAPPAPNPAAQPAPMPAPIPSPVVVQGPPVAPVPVSPQAPVAPPVQLAAQIPLATAATAAPALAVSGVTPPVSTLGAATAAQPAVWAAAAPMKGQSADEQARDRYACYQFAAAQTGFDPLRASGGVSPDQTAERKAAYERAQAACFEGRGYSVR